MSCCSDIHRVIRCTAGQEGILEGPEVQFMHRLVIDVGGDGMHVFSLRVGFRIPIGLLFIANIVLLP